MCVVARFYIKPLLVLLIAGACDDLVQVGGKGFVCLVGFIGGGQGVLVQVCADEAKIRYVFSGKVRIRACPFRLRFPILDSVDFDEFCGFILKRIYGHAVLSQYGVLVKNLNIRILAVLIDVFVNVLGHVCRVNQQARVFSGRGRDKDETIVERFVTIVSGLVFPISGDRDLAACPGDGYLLRRAFLILPCCRRRRALRVVCDRLGHRV